MKKILVLTDFSDCAYQATEAALEIAKKIGAEIQFLHCTDVPVDWLKLTDSDHTFYKDVEEKIKQIHSQLNALVNRADQEGIAARHSVGFNKNTGNLANYLGQNKIDFVIMGSEGTTGFKELFFGSHSQQVVRHSEVPVLVVKEPFDISNLRLVFVSAFEPDILAPFKKLVALAEVLDTRIDLIYVDTGMTGPHSWKVEKAMPAFELAAGDRLGFSHVVHGFTIEEGIEKYCKNRSEAVVCMATHGRTGIPRFLMGSLTERVVNHVDVSVLSLHM